MHKPMQDDFMNTHKHATARHVLDIHAVKKTQFCTFNTITSGLNDEIKQNVTA